MMKKKFFLFIYILFFGTFFSQESISGSNVFLNSNFALFDNSNHLWISQESLKNSLGNPLNVSTFYREIDDASVTRLSYNNSFYDFINNQLVSFELNNGAQLKIKDKVLKVGETLETEISAILPNSKKQGVIFNASSEYYELELTSTQNGVKVNLDNLLIIEVNTINSNKRISKIRFWYP